MAHARRTVVKDLAFGEGPRWHEGALWFSDMHGHQVLRATLDGETSVVAEVPDDRPSGLGWLADGRLIFVAMEAQKLMAVEGDGSVVEHADLSGIARGSINDMIVAADGTAYVGDMGGRLFRDVPVDWQSGQTIRVSPDGKASSAADELMAPNGHILSEDGRTLIVAESRGSRLSAFDVEPDGTLSNRRVFADIEPIEGQSAAPPDGICLDAEGAVWVAELVGRRLIRVAEGGQILDTITFEGDAPIASVLGGDDRRTLLVCVATGFTHHEVEAKRTGRIEAVDVPVAGAGRP